MLGSTTRVGPTTPALVTLHSLPTAHTPPSASWPRRPRRRRLEGHDEIAPPARPARPERAPAAAAASTRRLERSRGSWSSYWSLPSSGARSELRLILLPNEAPQSSQQGIEWQGSARVHGERHGRVAARRAEAAHLFPAVNSTISMMLSAESGAAGPHGRASSWTAR